MLPQEIVGRYRRYKRGTSRLVAWLVKTVSNECGGLGHIIDAVDLAGTTASSSSDKGKKGKKHAGKKRHNTGHGSGGGAAAAAAQLELTVRQLVELGEAICRHNPPPAIPEQVLRIAEDVIEGREGCHEWYAAQAHGTGSSVEALNRSHWHYIEALQKVRDLLLDARSRAVSSATVAGAFPDGDAAEGPNRESLNSCFAWLSVEDPGEDALGGELPSLAVKTSSGKAHVQVKLEQQKDDAAFQTWCFLQDLADVRRTVRRIWESYAQGDTSFLNAGLVTDTAFGLLRRADEDFQALNPGRSTDWQEVIGYLGLSYFVRDGIVSLHPTQIEAPGEPRMLNASVNVADLLCPIAFLCGDDLRVFMQDLCAASATGPTKTDAEPYHMHNVLSALYTICMQAHEDSHAPGNDQIILDEFFTALADVHVRGRVRMGTVVALQIYLDVHDLLGDQVFGGVKSSQRIFTELGSLVGELDRYRQASEAGLDDVKEEVQDLKFALRMAERQMKEDEIAEQTPGESSPEGKMCFPEPAVPASMASRIAGFHLFLYRVAVDFMRHGTFVIYAAHLYRALRAMGALPCDFAWPDMEFVLEAHGSNRLLVSDVDAAYDGARAARHFFLDLGMSLQAFARDRRAVTRTRLRGTRKICPSSPLLRAYLDDGLFKSIRLGTNHARLNTVEAALHALASHDEVKQARTPMRTRASSARKTCYTPPELLDTMTRRLRSEEPQFHFDFIRFTLSCAELMQAISDAYGELLPVDFGPTIRGPGQLVWKIFGAHPRSPLVYRVATHLQDHIQAHGDMYLAAAVAKCSGTLDPSLQPAAVGTASELGASRAAAEAALLELGITTYSFSGSSTAVYHPRALSDFPNLIDRGPRPSTETSVGLEEAGEGLRRACGDE